MSDGVWVVIWLQLQPAFTLLKYGSLGLGRWFVLETIQVIYDIFNLFILIEILVGARSVCFI